MKIQICVGSSCHLKGASEIVELFEEAVKSSGVEAEVTLGGSFCMGKCNREGVTVQIDDTVHTGVTVGSFKRFFTDNILNVLQGERK